MNTELKNELIHHVINTINDNDLDTFEDLHFHAFNEDYYIIGYYQAEQWLKQHDISPFEAIVDVIEWEDQVFGESHLKPEDINAEKIVNLYVYIKGEELLSEFDLVQDVSDLLKDLEGDLVWIKSKYSTLVQVSKYGQRTIITGDILNALMSEKPGDQE